MGIMRVRYYPLVGGELPVSQIIRASEGPRHILKEARPSRYDRLGGVEVGRFEWVVPPVGVYFFPDLVEVERSGVGSLLAEVVGLLPDREGSLLVQYRSSCGLPPQFPEWACVYVSHHLELLGEPNAGECCLGLPLEV